MKIKLLICILVSILAISCSKDPLFENSPEGKLKTLQLSTEEYLSVAYSNVEEFTSSQLLDIIWENDFVGKATLTRSTESATFNSFWINQDGSRISGAATRSINTKDKLLVYDIDIHNGNNDIMKFLVSADPKCPKLLSYKIEPEIKDSLYLNRSVELEEELTRMSIESIFAEREYITNLEDSLRKSTIERIKLELGIDNYVFDDVRDQINISDDVATRSMLNPNYPGMGASGYGPLLTTTWYNEYPYNDYMGRYALGGFFIGGDGYATYPVGDCTTAIAQVLAFCKPVGMVVDYTQMEWTWLTSTPTITSTSPSALIDMVAKLHKHIVDNTNVYDYWRYEGSGDMVLVRSYFCGRFTTATNMQTYLSKYLNLTSRKKWDLNSVISSLQNARPVIIYVDKKIESSSSSTTYAQETMVIDGFVYMNPGYHIHVKGPYSYYDGWYYLSSTYLLAEMNQYSTLFDTRNNNVWIIPDLRKK